MERRNLGIHLVGLQCFTPDVIRDRMWKGHSGSICYTVYFPMTGGNIPFQSSRSIHQRGQIYNVRSEKTLLFGYGHNCDVFEPSGVLFIGAIAFERWESGIGQFHNLLFLSLYFHMAQYNLLHTLVFRDPGSSRGAVAGTIVQPDFQAKSLRFRGGVGQSLPVSVASEGLFWPWIILNWSLGFLYG